MAGKTALLSLVSCFGLTLCAAFWWKSFILSLLFCIMQFLSFCLLVSHFKPYTKNGEFMVCSFFGFVCTFLGVFILLLPGYWLNLFTIVYNVGIICTLGSIVFMFVDILLEQLLQLGGSYVYDACTRYIQGQSDWLASAVQDVALELCARLLILYNLFLCDILEIFFKFGFVLGLTKFSPHQSQPIPFNKPGMMTDNGTQPLKKVDNTGQKTVHKLGRTKVRIFEVQFPFANIGAVFWNKGLDFLFMILRSWFLYVIHFIGVFILGAGCTVVGVWLRYVPDFGLTPCVFYSVGNMCIMMSTWFLESPSKQLEMMFDNTRAGSSACMIICFVLTQLTLFWWESFVLAFLFCIVYIVSTFWYCLSYIPCGRYGAEKLLSYKSTEQNNCS